MSELLRELYCGITNDHVLKEPIRLSCGHSICKQCVHDQVKIKTVMRKDNDSLKQI